MTFVTARARRLAGVGPSYLRIAWRGLARAEREALVVHQGVVLSEQGVLLTVRGDLRGWELPGGNADRGESHEETVCREILEETGLRVEVERRVGDYVRTGFLPHTARVSRCRILGGSLRPSPETPVVRWFPPSAVPHTLFPWYRAPLADALAARSEPVERHERQGLAAILAGMVIDLRMRWSGDRAGQASDEG